MRLENWAVLNKLQLTWIQRSSPARELDNISSENQSRSYNGPNKIKRVLNSYSHTLKTKLSIHIITPSPIAHKDFNQMNCRHRTSLKRLSLKTITTYYHANITYYMYYEFCFTYALVKNDKIIYNLPGVRLCTIKPVKYDNNLCKSIVYSQMSEISNYIYTCTYELR